MLREVLEDRLIDVKASDVRLLLRRVAADAGLPAPIHDWVLSRPMVYEALVDRDRWVVRATVPPGWRRSSSTACSTDLTGNGYARRP